MILRKRNIKRIVLCSVTLVILIVFIYLLYNFFLFRSAVVVDFSKPIQEIRAVNGINNGPKSGYEGEMRGETQWALDATKIYEELELPFVRTHDSEYPYGGERFIDIHCIFPDFTRDADDPEAYDFSGTDEYIKAILDSGADVLYRLGESIDPYGYELDSTQEGSESRKYTDPPEDYVKWAQICEHIVRHYNEGWNDGYHYGIEYWEIWNEPDVERQWSGTMEEYYELYRTTSYYLKNVYPELKVGGGVLGNVSKEAVTDFLDALSIDGEKTPLDFLSWHTYTKEPGEFLDHAAEVRSALDEKGYSNTLSILDEWNYSAGWKEEDYPVTFQTICSQKGAAFTTASLIMLQNSSIDLAMYYDGQFVSEPIEWCGLYRSEKDLLPGYYAFYYFNQLKQLWWQVDIGVKNIDEKELDGLYMCAASGVHNGILMTNYKSEEGQTLQFNLKINGNKRQATITRISEEDPEGMKTTKFVLSGLHIKLEPNELIYIELN